MPRPYSRLEIDKAFTRMKAMLHQEAVSRGNGIALHEDSYTGKVLNGGDRYDYDHIFPCEQIHSLYKDRLSDIQIAQVVNCRENIAVTLRSLNMSKGKKDPEDWLADSRNMISHGINKGLSTSAIQRAKLGIERLAEKLAIGK